MSFDPYYVNLTRALLTSAEEKLSKAQGYAVQSGAIKSPENIQKMINSVRREVDRLLIFLNEEE